MKWLLILCACAVVSSAMNFPSLKLLLEREKELLNNPEEVRELLEKLSGGRHVGKRLFLSLDSLKSAFDTVVDGVKSAAQTVAGGVETAVHKVEDVAQTVGHAIQSAAEKVGDVAQSALHGVEDAAHVVAEKVEGAAQDVAHFVSGAAQDVSHFFSSAAEKLAPLLDSIAKVAGPIAQQIGEVALQELVNHGPELLSMLGEAAVQAAIAAAGKRDVNIEHLAGIFSNAVQAEVNQTVALVKQTIAGIQSINADLKIGVDKLTSALRAGTDPRVAARDFLGVLINGLRRMEETGGLSLNLSEVDNIIGKSVHKFGSKLKEMMRLSAATHEKRFLLDNLLGLIHTGEQQLSSLLGSVEALALHLLQPTLDNVRAIAQTLLNNAGSVTAGQVLQAVTVLAPHQQELGPLFQQLLTLARGLGLQV